MLVTVVCVFVREEDRRTAYACVCACVCVCTDWMKCHSSDTVRVSNVQVVVIVRAFSVVSICNTEKTKQL